MRGAIAMDGAWRRTGRRPLKGRFGVDCNEGGRGTCGARCRFVDKEVAYRHSVQFSAETPPLEVLRCIMSEAATRGPPAGVSWRGGPAQKKMQCLCVEKAHVRAPSVRDVCV